MRKELTALRSLMDNYNIQAYLIPTDDFHGSECVGEHFKSRRYISGFTGSAGTLLVMQDMAGLWTDGRYFLQAASQLKDTGITLFKMGEPGVPTIPEYLEQHLKDGMIFAFDGRCMMETQADIYRNIVEKCGAEMRTGYDLVNAIWDDRPDFSKEPAWILEEEYSGESTASKIERVREEMRKLKADTFLLASLDDICWLLNVRGNDVECTPVVLSYLLMDQQQIIWYVQEECLSDEVRKLLDQNHITVRDYFQIYEDLTHLETGKSILFQPDKTNVTLVSYIPEGVKCIRAKNPTEYMKARKNPVEVANERIAHIKDGVALTRFMYYLKKKAVHAGETELSLADRLVEFRSEWDHYIEESFNPIIGYGDHGAIVHYSAQKETDRPVLDKSFLLVDTGGHYLEGTTDTTRTFVMGPLTQEEKELYTAVLRGHIDLCSTRFLSGMTGQNLDVLAHIPLWDKGLDFNHGTGHGVGYLLNVHEGPNSFRNKTKTGSPDTCAMEPGMITSDEPGVYLEGKFGIRLENLIVCCEDSSDPGFLYFEPLTMVPFERDAIIVEDMTDKEIRWLNHYHESVYRTLSPYLNEEEKAWLYDVTREI